MFEVKSTKIKTINLHSPDELKQQTSLTVRIESNIGIAETKKDGIATLNCQITEESEKEHDSSLHIDIVLDGQFSSDEEIVQTGDELQAQVLKELYPYLRAAVSMVTAIAGIPTITLPTIHPAK